MCGIVGFVGTRDCSEILLTGLSRLEYRGYDSAGIAIATADDGVRIVRAKGKLANLQKTFHAEPFHREVGHGHTRWATHGSPTERNAHPHKAGRVVLAHNGIIENYATLRESLAQKGCEFLSATDTEVVAHLINTHLKTEDTLHAAVLRSLDDIVGSYALVVMDIENPDHLVVARNASPMVLGRAVGECFAASDVPAVLGQTRDFIFLEDGDTAVLKRDSMEIFDDSGTPVDRPSRHISWDPVSAEKQGYKHFMLKEIYEQPARIVDTLRGRIDPNTSLINLAEIDFEQSWIDRIEKVIFVACGTSYYAAMIAKYLIEGAARITVEVDLASEFRYRNPVVTDRTLCIAMTQSGETADTLAAMRYASKAGAKSIAICNVIESTIAREADCVLYTHAGPEIGVASTKAFTTQLAVVSLIAMWLGSTNGKLAKEEVVAWSAALRSVPTDIESMLNDHEQYEKIAREYGQASSCLYLGRGVQFPIAMEGALKLKEISYIHAEGYASGEMKHGPIALIDEAMPIVAIAPKDEVYEKTISNIEEVAARDGRIIAIVSEGDSTLKEIAEVLVEVPITDSRVLPILTSVAVQLLAYHIADFKGTDIDQPRNLAKSVTVE